MKLIFATQNDNKLLEIQNLIGNSFKLLSLKDFGIFEDIPETKNTIKENAYDKAKYIYNKTNINCFADDTGLEVDALNGEPGVNSARYAGEDKNSINNIKKLLKNLSNISNRKAQFITIISLIFNNEEFYFEGVVKGKIIEELKGKEGFGYDPVFLPDGYTKTFAEMSLAEKNKISHRAIAFKKLIRFLNRKILL